MRKLKLCPFCGGEATLEKFYRPDNPLGRQWEYWVECHGPETDECQGFSGMEYAYYDAKQCADLWNTRPLEDELLEALIVAEDELSYLATKGAVTGTHKEVRSVIRKAIAKATGETT